MAGIETYGGKCPICGKNMLQKWESCGYGFMFDACPWCGFVGTTSDIHAKDAYNEAMDMIMNWDYILKAYDCKSIAEFIEKLSLLPNEYDSESSDFYPSVLDYTDALNLPVDVFNLEEFKAFMSLEDVASSFKEIMIKLANKGINIGDMVVGYLDMEGMSNNEVNLIIDCMFTGIVTGKTDNKITVKWVNGEEKEVDFEKDIAIAVNPKEYEEWHNKTAPDMLKSTEE